MNGESSAAGAPRGRLPKRRHRKARCRGCGLHAEICVCPLLPRVDLPQEFLVIQNSIEILRPTNTGRIVATMLPNTRLLPFGLRADSVAALVQARDEVEPLRAEPAPAAEADGESGPKRSAPFDESPLRRDDTDYLLLFPSDDAADLTPEMAAPRPGRRVALVLLDGTWHQASRMSHRIAALRGMRRVKLPPGAPSSWTIRNPLRPEQLCTLEAAIRVVDVLGRRDEAGRMMDGLELIEARMLYMKGRLPRPRGLEDVRAERLAKERREG
ncbi:MAG: DTW domain-containing protein [Lentisphaerae bacterium]|nr:DTW domain-containing protein [Lentisphaerota bacterium]